MDPQEQNCVQVEKGLCPNCGYCPHCGRGNPQRALPTPYMWPDIPAPEEPQFVIICESQNSNNAHTWAWRGQPFVTGLSVAT